MADAVFIDTSALYAFINSKDIDHKTVKDYLERFKGRLHITNFIFDEIITLVMARMGHANAVLTGNTLLNPKEFVLTRCKAADELKAWELFVNRPDKHYSFTDCTSFAIMKKLGIKKFLATDSHFIQEGFETVL
jgi:predicted nucleic acid-binding protein